MFSAYRERSAVCVFVLLCLMSLSHSASLSCEDLVRPLEQLNPHRLEGRWALIASSFTNRQNQERFKDRDSAIIKFANISDTSGMFFTRIFRFNDSCQYFHSNISVEGSGFTDNQFNITVTFLYTSCPDCMMMRLNITSKKMLLLNLFSRRREVEQERMEEFKAQVECLKTLPPVVMDPAAEFCPEQANRDPEQKTEEKTQEPQS